MNSIENGRRQPAQVEKNASADARIIRLLGLPPVPGYCGRPGRAARLRNLRNPSHEKVSKFSCGSWGCRVCKARLLEEAGLHYGQRLLLSAGDVLFRMDSDPARWERDKARLRRASTSWVRIGCPGHPGVTIGRAPPEFGLAISDVQEAICRLGEALRDLRPFKELDRRCRPINPSGDWRPPRRKSRYQRVGWVRAARPEVVLAILEKAGIEGKARPGSEDTIWDVGYEIPAMFSDAERTGLLAEIEVAGK